MKLSVITQRANAKPVPLNMPRSAATLLAFTALLLSDLTLPSRGFAPSVIANKNKSFQSSSLSMVFGFGQTRPDQPHASGGGKRKRPDQPHSSSFSARSSVVSTSADSGSIRTKIDTSNFGVGDDTITRDAIRMRDDVYQKSLHRLLCDGEEECIF